MINYTVKASTFEKNSSYGRFFARAITNELIDIEKLSKLMKHRNLPYSEGAIKGLLTDMVDCIKEQLLAGNSVKIDDLAIFGISIRNVEGGAESEKDFNAAKHIEGVSLTCRAAGDLMNRNVKAEIEFNKVDSCNCKNEDTDSDSGTDNPEDNGGNTGGEPDGGGDLVG